MARHGVGPVLVLSNALVALSCAGYAVATAWPVMLACGLLAGLGAGAIDAGINVYAAARFSPRLVSWLHASWSAGAALGPLIMTAVLGAGLAWRWGYALIGLLLGMTLSFIRTRSRWDAGRDLAPGSPAEPLPGAGAILRRPIVWSGLLFFFVYAGLEVTAGQWSYSLLTEGRGLAPGAAGLWVGGFWGAMTAGRVIAGGLAGRVPAGALLRVAVGLAPVMALALAADLGPLASGLALVGLGFLLAPIYPLAVVATPGRVGERSATRVIAYQVGAAYLGTAALPGLAGVLARAYGLEGGRRGPGGGRRGRAGAGRGAAPGPPGRARPPRWPAAGSGRYGTRLKGSSEIPARMSAVPAAVRA